MTVPQHDVLLDILWLWKSQLSQYETVDVAASLFCKKNKNTEGTWHPAKGAKLSRRQGRFLLAWR